MSKIFGKSDIYNFKILIDDEIKAYDFLKVNHYEYGDVLAQVLNVTRENEKLIGDCFVIGFLKDGVLNSIKIPFSNEDEIFIADDKFICDVLGFDTSSRNFIGVLEGHPKLKVKLDLKKLISKHISILAKSGAGKSYSVGVILEEIIKKNIPVLILDPHGEYSSLKFSNDSEDDLNRLKLFGLESFGFNERIREFTLDTNLNKNCEPIKLNIEDVSKKDFLEMFPQKLSPSQNLSLLNILSNTNKINFDELIFQISQEENNSKWGLISILEQLKKLNIFNENYTKLNEIIKSKKVSIINLRGVDSFVSEIFLAQLLKQLFLARKKNEIPPFFLVLEEAHNFIPEKNLGEMKTSKIVRSIAAEGRKFGIGLCVITQRPAKVDKNVISQCSTQIILKITNSQDLKAVVSSSEGLNKASEFEIQKLNIGTALLCGAIDIPLKINIRPRITKHGGETTNIVLDYENDKELKEEVKTKKPNIKMEQKDYEKVFLEFIENSKLEHNKKVVSIPAVLITIDFENKKVDLLVDKINLKIIKELNSNKFVKIDNELLNLNEKESFFLKNFLSLKDKFNPTELLLNSNISYAEIDKLTKVLEQKNIIGKDGNMNTFKKSLFLKKITQLSFSQNLKHEEVKVFREEKENISSKQIVDFFRLYFKVLNEKDIYILENI